MKWIVVIASVLLLSACAVRQQPASITNANDVVSDQAKIIDYSKPAGKNLLDQKRFYFGFNSAKIMADDVEILQAHAAYLTQHPQINVILMGYSDPVGNRAYNDALAKRRAQAIADQLIKSGVAKKRIRIVAYGMTGKIKSAHANDRRVDLVYGG